MSALARSNGWRGFDGIGDRVEGGWLYRCDGMPTLTGCGEEIVVPRRWTRTGKKKASGWLVCYGTTGPVDPGDDGKGHDLDVVLTFGPKCAVVVEQQDRARPTPDEKGQQQ